MPVAPTYPGVYIEEIPSGVHTITGVATSIAAFIGYTQKGAVDEAVHIFSFADFERAFGGLSVDSPLSYCVRDFFQNGGSEAYVVRTALGASSASVAMKNPTGTTVLVVSAISAGQWGNNLEIDLDYNTVNPTSYFNLSVVEYVQQNGTWVAGTTEKYRNLTLNSTDPGFVVNAINPASQLISVALAPGLAISGQGSSRSGPLTVADLQQLDLSHNHLSVRVNGVGPFDVTVTPPNMAVLTLAQALTNLANELTTKINAQAGGGAVAVAPTANNTLTITSGNTSDRSSVQVTNALTSSATKILKFGLANGGLEVDGSASYRPSPTGTTWTPQAASCTSGALADPLVIAAGTNRLGVSLNGAAPSDVVLTPTPAAGSPLTDIANDLANQINTAAGATVVAGSVAASKIVITSVDPVRCWSIHFTAATSNDASAVVKIGPTGNTDVPPASSSTSGTLPAFSGVIAGQSDTITVGVNGQKPFDVTFPTAGFPTDLATAASKLQAIINAALGTNAVTVTLLGAAPNQTIQIVSNDATRWSAIHVTSATSNDAAAALKLGLANGGTEDASLQIDINQGASAGSVKTIRVPLWAYWASPKSTPQPRSLDDVATDIDQALKTLANNEPYLVGAAAMRIGNTLRILPGTDDPNDVNTSFTVSSTAAWLTSAASRNVARYAPGAGVTTQSQVAGATGNDGTAPTDFELLGDEAAKTGLYALEDVDLFNLLIMPDATAAGGMMDVLTAAIEYCTRRRAFMIIDAPEQVSTFAQAQTWSGNAASPLRSRNSALYFPRLRVPDPLMGGVVRTFAAAGALAGIYARTDAQRGVWKAPAGTAATVVGATGLSYTLNDGQNGTLNPLAINCLRTFPVIGTVSWGARTGNGADILADEYKYIPVRRLALFLEESLYRGTQWAVFEPNDEPLWAQIRLNLGAFMHTLFAQGAFQGQTPRDAYFVKCDKETTTQNDIDLGRVNIVVGFAPLEPAEFVIIQIQQIAGAIQT